MVGCVCGGCVFFFFKQKTAYEMRISDWSSDVCSSDLLQHGRRLQRGDVAVHAEDAVGGDHRRALGMPPQLPDRALDVAVRIAAQRSEERRVGQECVSTCRSRWSP